LDQFGDCACLLQLHLAIPKLIDPMFGVIAHGESSHQFVPIEDQVSQALQGQVEQWRVTRAARCGARVKRRP
jgi:hypothetical protein